MACKVWFLDIFHFSCPSSFLRCCVCVCMLSHLKHFHLFATLWTVAPQAPLSTRYSRQEYWSGLPCLPLGDLPDPGIESVTFMSPALVGGFYHLCHLGRSKILLFICSMNLSLFHLPKTDSD